jgi:hypothetical protein
VEWWRGWLIESEVKAPKGCSKQRPRLSEILSANQRSRLQDIVSPIRGLGFQRYCSPIRGQGCTGLCHQSDATIVKETVRLSEVKAPRGFFTAEGKAFTDTVRQSEVKAARYCVANQRPRRSEILFANQRSRLHGIVSPIRC